MLLARAHKAHRGSRAAVALRPSRHTCASPARVQECGYDGTDCAQGASECYTDVNGTDYRGTVSKTASGLECQFWSHQSPQQHTKSHQNFPEDGLGGHNHCRNPGREELGPYATLP